MSYGGKAKIEPLFAAFQLHISSNMVSLLVVKFRFGLYIIWLISAQFTKYVDQKATE